MKDFYNCKHQELKKPVPFNIRAFCDDWHTCEIMWHNIKLDEYRVLSEDSSEDYITLDDINGIDMITIN